MIIQFTITFVLIGTFFLLMLGSFGSRLTKILIFPILLAGVVATWKPEWSTGLANFLGVGRGADLLLYVWVLFSVLSYITLFEGAFHQKRQLTKITRKLALLEGQCNGQEPFIRQDPS